MRKGCEAEGGNRSIASGKPVPLARPSSGCLVVVRRSRFRNLQIQGAQEGTFQKVAQFLNSIEYLGNSIEVLLEVFREWAVVQGIQSFLTPFQSVQEFIRQVRRPPGRREGQPSRFALPLPVLCHPSTPAGVHSGFPGSTESIGDRVEIPPLPGRFPTRS